MRFDLLDVTVPQASLRSFARNVELSVHLLLCNTLDAFLHIPPRFQHGIVRAAFVQGEYKVHRSRHQRFVEVVVWKVDRHMFKHLPAVRPCHTAECRTLSLRHRGRRWRVSLRWNLWQRWAPPLGWSRMRRRLRPAGVRGANGAAAVVTVIGRAGGRQRMVVHDVFHVGRSHPMRHRRRER